MSDDMIGDLLKALDPDTAAKAIGSMVVHQFDPEQHRPLKFTTEGVYVETPDGWQPVGDIRL